MAFHSELAVDDSCGDTVRKSSINEKPIVTLANFAERSSQTDPVIAIHLLFELEQKATYFGLFARQGRGKSETDGKP